VGKVYAGYWEFPGGKIEPGESAPRALARELHEELGINVERAYPWITRDYDYEHAAVRLRFYRVTRWSGELHGREAQQFAWQHGDALNVAPILPANGPILRGLALPTLYGVSNAWQVGAEVFLERLDAALNRGLRLVQVRENALERGAAETLTHRIVQHARAHGAQVLVNTDVERAMRAGADGVHLTASRLVALDARPDMPLVAASCHDVRELAHAAALGLDFVVLGPVAETASHPGASPLGWARFRELIADYPLPVFAIGGLGSADLEAAWQAGAHGIAAIRGCWTI
jgi:8-oxo-dGTP diphosphatase